MNEELEEELAGLELELAEALQRNGEMVRQVAELRQQLTRMTNECEVWRRAARGETGLI